MHPAPHTQQVLDLASQQGLLRASQLQALGIGRVVLTRLTASGRLERVGRGVYRVPGMQASEHESLATLAVKVPQAVFCLLTALQFLKARAPKVGLTGFCMGGALTLLAAQAPELDAAVVWYGCPPLEYIDASKIKIPLQGHWATQDEFFKIDTVAALEEKLKAADVHFEFHRYLAHHAFANEEAVGPGRIPATQYDPVWAQQAWDRALRFFGKHLG